MEHDSSSVSAPNSACSEPGAQGITAAAEESADAATDPHRAQAEVMTSVQSK
jgi:hypothetical protein